MVIKKNNRGKYYFTDAGEVSKITRYREQGENYLQMYDENEKMFMISYTGGNYARYYSAVTVHFIDEQTEEQYGTELVYCCDPRVVTARLICFWLEQNSDFNITDEQVNAIINPVMKICDAEEWLAKNGFVPNNIELKEHYNEYSGDFKALKYPPTIDIDLDTLRRQE